MTTLDTNALMALLQERFLKNPQRHRDINWEEVEKRMRENADKLTSIVYMEQTGGEPDVIGKDPESGKFIFCDCAPESPAGRRSLCYDKKALDERKEHKPAGNVLDAAATMGIELLNENDYRFLQKKGAFDTKTSSWIATPDSIRKLGGALFADYRYGTVFVYHNGASSYYAARGFRGKILI